MKRKGCSLPAVLLGILLFGGSCVSVQIVPDRRAPQEEVSAGRPPREIFQPEKAPRDQEPPEEAPGDQVPKEKWAKVNIPPQEIPPQATPAKKSFFERMFQKITPEETFSRTYPIEFASFHPKANSALQDYARIREGTSFQISRLGSDEVVMRGIYIREGTQERYSATLTLKPAGPKRSQVEIRVAPVKEASSSQDPEAAAKEIFLIIEKTSGPRAP